MLDISRFMGDGIGKRKTLIKNMFYVCGTGTVALPSAVNVECSLALRLSGNLGGPAEGRSSPMPTISVDGASVIINSQAGNQPVIIIEFDSEYVKSFQSGSFSASSGNVNTAINTVVPDNCLVWVDGGYTYYATPSGSYDLRGSNLQGVVLNSTSLVTAHSNWDGSSTGYSWKVLELKVNAL